VVYNYNGKEPIKIGIDELTEKQKDLIFNNKTFCMYPWIHLHAFPTGEAYPCCNTEMSEFVGNTRNNTLEEIWHSGAMTELRQKMLAGEKIKGCTRCYEQEDAGFFSMRMSANKHFGHHIELTDNPTPPMRMIYWDIRFSNLCNLRCRSCGHIFSSNWYDDQVKLAGSDWATNNKRINFAGRSEDDIWNQLEPQIDNLEQVYFAGGEPLIMEEHYRLLKELIKRGKHDVRLIYNTNFTQVDYKKTNVFELWREFNFVSVGASLDAMGKHAEYIRKNTVWTDIIRNREYMLKICPRVDFYISPTLSVLNAFHLPHFHRDWVERGYIKPQDLNRIDILPQQYKINVQELYLEHLNWLKPQDHLKRATTGFESAINFMMASDKSNLLKNFISKTAQLDKIRNESILEFIPEMRYIYD
jgi:MoaA/NifB/PqqE/SkfB family radical SAM enzyme